MSNSYVLRKEKRYLKTLKKIYSSVYVRGEKIKKHRAEDRNVGKDVEMSQGVEQGKKAKSRAKKEKEEGSKHLPAVLAAGKFNFDPVDSAVIPKFNL